MHSSNTGSRFEPLEISLGSGPSRIILAEDDPDLREMLASLLRTEGYEVIEAGNGLELFDVVGSFVKRAHGQKPVDLVVSDVRMPGLSGLSVLRRLRASDWSTPVVLITAFADARTRLEAGRLGAVVLDKPLDLGALLGLVRHHGENPL